MNRKKVFLFIAAGVVSVVAHGQGLVNGRLEMTNVTNNDRRITNVGMAIDTADAMTAIGIRQNRATYAVSTGTNNSLFVNLPGINGTYKAGMVVTFLANGTNTGPVSLNVNGWGAKNVFYNVNNPLAAKDIINGQVVSVIYDGANFQIISPLAQMHDFSGQLQGDVTGGQTSTLIAAGKVTTAKLADSVATAIKIKGSSVNTVHLVDSSVTSVKIKGRAVNTVHFADSAATAIKIKSASVANVQLIDSAATAVKIKGTSVATVQLIDSAATAPKIKTAAVNTVHLVDSAVVAAKIKSSAVNSVHIVNNAVNSVKITDGSIADADIIAAAGIPYSKLVLAGSVKNADISNTAAIQASKLAMNGSIVNGDVSASAGVVYSKLALANSITNADVNTAAAIDYNKLNLASSLQTTDLVNASVTTAKISSTGATNGQVIGYNGTTVTWVAAVNPMTNLNNATGGSQTFASNTAGNDFAINTAGNIHTVSIPSASATARGVVTSAAQTIGGNKTFNNNTNVNGNLTVGANQLTVAGATGNVAEAGNLAVGATTNTAKVVMEVNSTTGTFVLPRMATAIANPPIGSMMYNTTSNKMQVYTPDVYFYNVSTGSNSLALNPTQTIGQTIIANTNDVLKTATLTGFPVTVTGGTLTANLYDINGGLLATANPVVVSPGSSNIAFDFTAANYTLVSGTYYYIVFLTADAQVTLRCNSSNPYPDGTLTNNDAVYGGGSFDLLMELKGTNSAAGWKDL